MRDKKEVLIAVLSLAFTAISTIFTVLSFFLK